MRRTPLRRGKPLRAAPAGASRPGRHAPDPEEVAAWEAFKRAVEGQRCVSCGRTKREAYEATGMGHSSHHGIRRQILRRLGLPEYDPRLAVCLCEEPCHRRHHSRQLRIPRSSLPAALKEFVAEHDLWLELEREYPLP